MKPLTITTDRFEADVLDSPLPVLIDFWAPWCGPCRAVAPLLDQIAAEYDGSLRVAKVNIDEEPQIAAAFRIRSIPAILVLHDRKVIAATTGALRKDALVSVLGLDKLPRRPTRRLDAEITGRPTWSPASRPAAPATSAIPPPRRTSLRPREDHDEQEGRPKTRAEAALPGTP